MLEGWDEPTGSLPDGEHPEGSLHYEGRLVTLIFILNVIIIDADITKHVYVWYSILNVLIEHFKHIYFKLW